MKRFVTIILLFLMCFATSAQTINQKGVTYRYNGKNKRTPIGGVYIKPVTANNGVLSDESNGTFTLALNSLQMGSRIGNVRVTKQGMMVFNQQVVDEWSVRKDPLCLILCNADEFQKQKKNLIAIGESQTKKKYDKKLAELKKQNDANQLKIDEYYNKLDSLEKEYQNALKHMDEYADVFARIDESEVDTVAQRAIEMFNRGEIEESIHLLEQQNYMEKIKQANRTIEQADAMISTAEQAKSFAEQDLEKYIQGVKTQIAGYKLQNEWDKAKALLKGLADNLNSLDAISDYALFCHTQKDFKEAEQYYLKLVTKIKSTEGLSDLGRIAVVQNALTLLYAETNRFDESEVMLKSAILILGRLAKSNPRVYSLNLALSYYSGSLLYTKSSRFAESEEMSKSALAILKRLSKDNSSEYEKMFMSSGAYALLYAATNRLADCVQMCKSSITIHERLSMDNPKEHEPILAGLYNILACAYHSMNHFAESEEMYKSAIAILKRLDKSNPQVYKPNLANSYCGLARLYNDTKRFVECEEMYNSALAILKRLAKSDPQAYEPDLANSYYCLACLFDDTHRYAESEKMYNSALDVRERLAEVNPQTYEPDLASTYYALALLYSKTHRYYESEQMYESTLAIRERLSKANPKVYEPNLFETYANLAILYSDTHRFAESEEMYKSALEILERLAKATPQEYEPYLASCYNNLAVLYSDTQRFSESEELHKSAMAIRKRLSKENPQVYEPELANSYYCLALLYDDTKRFVKSEEMYKLALEIYSQLNKKKPQSYALKLMWCYFGLGRVTSFLDRPCESNAYFMQSKNISKQILENRTDSTLYYYSLANLSNIAKIEKDYISAYTYNEELLPFVNELYKRDADKYIVEYFYILLNNSFYANLLGKFKEGEQYSLEAIKVDSTQHMAYTNLAAALLFQGTVEDAENLYRQYKAEFKEVFLDDFAEYERLGVIPEERKKDVERIKAMLKEDNY